MKKTTLLAVLVTAAMILTGCKQATVAERETAAQQAIASGNYDSAKRDIEKALRAEGVTAEERTRLNALLADVNGRIDARRISNEDDARAAGAAALQAAKASADRKDWKSMSRELSSANGHAKKANDPALNAAIAAMVGSEPVKLVGARAAYRSLCSKADWSTTIEIFDGDPFWLDLSAVLDRRLERAVDDVGDAELKTTGYAVTKEWREYIRAKDLEKNTRNDNSGVGILLNGLGAAGRVKNRLEYIQAQGRFEARLNAMMGATVMPASTYAPTRRDQTFTPAATTAPVAAAPIAITAGPAAPTTIPAGVPIAPATAPSVRAATPPPTATPVPATTTDRSAPNFDDLR